MTDHALLRIVFGLLLVIAAILCCAWLARRSGLINRGSGQVLKSVATMTLGPRNHVTVIQVEQTWLVVGVSSSQMTLLHTLPARTVDDTPAGPPADGGFAERLAHVLKRSR